jgi:hypothetical protein
MKLSGAVRHTQTDLLQRIALAVLRCTLTLGLALGLAGCLLIPEDKTYQSLVESEQADGRIYKLYPGKRLPASELAILLLGDIPSITVNGLGVSKTDYQEVHLLPGLHALAWRKVFGFSVMVEPSMVKEAELALEVRLKAGQTYKLFADRTTGQGYRFYFWIADMSSGEVIGGSKKP